MENWKAIAEDIIKSIKVLKEENNRLETENEELKETISKISYILKNEGYVPFETIKKETNTKTPVYDYQLIDLGLPSGTLWMDRNIGASSPEDAGLYFAWGETQGYSADEVGKTKQFSWDDYKFNIIDDMTKYNSTDGLTTLETTDDAVLQKCSMPTKEQLQELIDETTPTWTTQNGVNGRLFTSKTNGNSIFVPAAGYGGNGSMFGVGSYGGLWSSSLREDDTNYAWSLFFNSDNARLNNNNRCNGKSVRGVVNIPI